MPQKPRVTITFPQRASQPQRRPRDIRQTKEYKLAARRWVSTIVALPILMYTSYVLYERVYLDKSQKHLVDSRTEEGGKEGGV
ncbi:hypothetical protein BDV28DRAFT_80218 [Aspergillus coremiiformis]|uniref:Uncharacterized protein n=1 Tax=Aspergillus coremiiformis TaxID=138285 RepID=A0A5N6YUZ2_9EURO|nr:hypothetical protein BDV28DRAFT_80218 [Aspergillus coremiiformis]